MNKPSDIYLTDEVGNFAKNNPNFNITDLKNEAVTLGLGILFVLIALVLGWAGIKKTYLAGSSASSNNESKRGFEVAGTALVVLALTMSIFTYLGVFSGNFSLTPLSRSEPTYGGVTNPPPINEEVGPVGQRLEAMLATEATNRNTLSVQRIDINKGACVRIGQTNCTSVGGMGSQTLSLLASLKRVCDCNFTVTGGTEWWIHSAKTRHQPGALSAVDLSFDSITRGVSKFIYESALFTKTVAWSNCHSAFTWNGFYFCDEKAKGSQPRHWHIQPI